MHRGLIEISALNRSPSACCFVLATLHPFHFYSADLNACKEQRWLNSAAGPFERHDIFQSRGNAGVGLKMPA
jgi:hypothetical protein